MYYKTGEQISIRDGFGEGLLVAGAKHKNILALSADLTESVRMHKFAEKFPERFRNTGIQEQNMAAVAAGLALEGFVPFIGSFANFQPGRNLDQIRTSICMMNANVKIISSHAGFSYGEDGITVQALEDVAIMRTLPNMHVLIPADANQAAEMVGWVAEIEGPVYLRLGRAVTPVLPKTDDFKFGKGQLLQDGDAVTVIASGYMVEKALQAAKELEGKGTSVRVINMHTIKPLDKEIIIKAAKETMGIVVAEESQKAGGLGSAVAEVLAEIPGCPPMRFVAVEDQFGESGTQAELMESRGLTVASIVSKIQELV